MIGAFASCGPMLETRVQTGDTEPCMKSFRAKCLSGTAVVLRFITREDVEIGNKLVRSQRPTSDFTVRK